ncbi:NACHT domain-containing protein [Streptomyces sasae]|uniref:NACHT domain-containing protein n=1 Tax=Streptomyces sasae TaxID=1266772 RepID=UPI00292EA656|nr:NACHT domain-containing protein [Streptomyces sasae]
MTGLGERRRRRNWQLIGALCALAITGSAAYAVSQIIHGSLQPGDTAGVLGLPLGVAGLVAAVVALRKPVEGNETELARSWAATLASQVETGESVVWRQLLGDDTRRINLTYALHPAAVRPATAPVAGQLTADGLGPVALPDILTYYRATRPLRLVVTGAAGAGKTVLALELLLALIDRRAENDPVPVRIPLSRWDTERQTLPDLLQQRLVEAYDWPADLAASLVRHHLVLPVLDGLDEMDPPAPDGSPDPAAPRAAAVIRSLNTYQQGRNAGPLILTCRTRHYDALAERTEVLDAARISVAPVGADDARAYLADRALDAARWRLLLDHMAVHPSGFLATVLSTPWRLCLVATVYHHDGDPAELLALLNADALDHHLLARYIPAACRTVPNPRNYAAIDIHRWLHHLTTHLNPAGTLEATTSAGVEATDLLLHELWPVAGRFRVLVADALLSTLALLIPLPFVWAFLESQSGTLPVGISVFAVLCGVSASTTGTPKARTLGNPFAAPQRRRELAGSVVSWLVLVLTIELAVSMAGGLLYGIAGVGGLMFGQAVLLGKEPGTSLGARDVIRSDALAGLARGLTAGLAGGVTIGLLAGLVFEEGLAASLTVGGVIGVVCGVIFGVMFGAEASRRYAVFLLCSRRRLPFRLGLFLDWAVTAGLMRYSGPAYQFRHRELQHWLRQHPHPPTAACRRSP